MSAPPPVLPASLSTSGYQDGLGRRSLAFDRESGSVLERLVVRPELVAFERALRQRADHLATFDDERVARVRDIEHERDAGRLTVVSEFVAGRRLADLLDEGAQRGLDENAAPSIDQALGLLLQLLPALGALHTVAGVSHGVVGPGRIAVTPAGQIVLLDTIYGPSLERLQLSRRRLWTDLRVAPAPSAGPCRFDVTADIAQAGLAAAAMTVSRPLGEREYPNGLRALIDETVEIAQLRGSARFATALQRFFERALPLPARRIYATADEALAAVQELVTAEMGVGRCRRALTALVRDAEAAAPVARESEPAREDDEIVLALTPLIDPASSAARDDEEPITITIDVDQPIVLAAEIEEPIAVAAEPPPPAALVVDLEPPAPLTADVEPPVALAPTGEEPFAPEPAVEEFLPAAVARVREVEVPAIVVPEVPPAPVVEPATLVAVVEEPEPWLPQAVDAPVVVSGTPEPEPVPEPIAAQAPAVEVPLSPVTAPAAVPANPKRKGSGRKHRDRLRSADAPAVAQQPAPVVPQPPVAAVRFEAPPPVAPPVPVRMPLYDQLPQPVWTPAPAVPLAPIAAAPSVVAPVAATPVIAVRVKAEAPSGYLPPTMSPRARGGQFHDMSAHHATAPRPETQRASTNWWKLLAAAAVVIAVGVMVSRSNLLDRLPNAATAVTAKPEPVAAPATASTPGGSLVVETQPDGARVLIDGKPAGESPLKVDGVAPGSHIITLITSSATLKRSVKIEAGRTSTLDVPVYSGWLAIYAPIVLHVAENGRTIGTTEHGKLMLPPGRHTLTLSNKDLGYIAVRKVDVESGEERALSIEPRGAISLNAVPWAEVFVDGKRVGETPIANLEVPLGTREILFKHPQFGERRITEVVTAIGPSAVSVDFSK